MSTDQNTQTKKSLLETIVSQQRWHSKKASKYSLLYNVFSLIAMISTGSTALVLLIFKNQPHLSEITAAVLALLAFVSIGINKQFRFGDLSIRYRACSEEIKHRILYPELSEEEARPIFLEIMGKQNENFVQIKSAPQEA